VSRHTTEPPETIAAEDLGVAIDRDGEVPIGVQLAWALRTRIAERRFAPGQRLPGLRDLARATGVNVNTARAVYQRLEQEGLIESQQGSGTFVASSPREASEVGSIAASAARRARRVGVDPREVAAALYVSSQPLAKSEQPAAARRALLRDQITVLERALGELEAAHPGIVARTADAQPGAGPALLDAGELEQVRAGLVRRLASVQGAIDALTTPGQASTPGGASAANQADAPEQGPTPSEGAARSQTQATRAKQRGRPRAAPAGA
jgi:DNA-binding transcriptional regulator YhcF (GntR family)